MGLRDGVVKGREDFKPLTLAPGGERHSLQLTNKLLKVFIVFVRVQVSGLLVSEPTSSVMQRTARHACTVLCVKRPILTFYGGYQSTMFRLAISTLSQTHLATQGCSRPNTPTIPTHCAVHVALLDMLLFCCAALCFAADSDSLLYPSS
jgi:hypothetical protein